MKTLEFPSGESLSYLAENPALVSLLQEGLKARGFYGGEIDADFGKLSKAALQLYLKPSEDLGELSGTIRQVMVKLAFREIGVREIPKDSNTGPRVMEYQAASWLEGTRFAWCAAFICWLVAAARNEIGGQFKWKRPKTAGAWDFENWAKGEYGEVAPRVEMFKPGERKIEPGDILVLRRSHICLAVDDEWQGEVSTIEGNTNAAGSREGGGVYKRTRAINKLRSIIRIN